MRYALIVIVLLVQFYNASGEINHKDINYLNMGGWHQHPNKKENVLINQTKNTLPVDVFYIHPTTSSNGNGDNDEIISAQTKKSVQYSIYNQASAYSEIGNIYAPAYRQAHLSVLLGKDSARKVKALSLAYADIYLAFETYLKNWNRGKPIFIVAHSQGSFHALRLLEDFFEREDSIKLVTAYIVGYTVPEDLFTRVFHKINYCNDSTETGCIVSWRTYGKHGNPKISEKRTYANLYGDSLELSHGKKLLCTNPVTWNTSPEWSEKNEHLGMLYPTSTGRERSSKSRLSARVKEGVLWVDMRNWAEFNAPGHDFHIYDYNFFYYQIVKNVNVRWKSYQLVNE